tara:strand:+ start:237 stop:725 length:489 start_codon:yes stop_codon:yes gene_type:complete
MHNSKITFFFKLIFLISSIAIISAYYFQYILKYQPCNLCLIERIPYALSLIVLLINLKFKNIEKYTILVLIFIFLFSAIVSIYHFGIEQNYFDESSICNLKDSAKILSKADLLIELQKITVSCKDVTFRVFGLSLTTINMIVSLLLLILLIKFFIFYEKVRY